MKEYKTDARGLVEVKNIDQGECGVSCKLEGARREQTFDFVSLTQRDEPQPSPVGGAGAARADAAVGPFFIAEIEEHKVRTGESIASLAKSHGMTWQDLSIFNWGTAVPDEINEHLRDDVGCTQKTPDGFNYSFRTEDDPGIVYIPRKWSREGLATEQTHVIRVKQVQPFVLILENDLGLRIPEAEYEATLADASKRRGRLSRGGVAVIKDPPPGEVEVEYLDLDDVQAKSLAASARQGFDERDMEEVQRLLRQTPSMVKMAIEAYNKYFNDYSGKGFVEDFRNEFRGELPELVADSLLAFSRVTAWGSSEEGEA